MTDDDRAKLAAIAAWHLSRHVPQDQIERYLYQVASAAEQDDIDQALRSAWGANLTGDAISRADLGEAAEFLQGMREDGARGWRATYRVKTGPGPDDWAGGAVRFGVEAGPGSILAGVESDAREVMARIREHDSLPGGGLPDAINIGVPEGTAGRVEIVYVVPL